MVINVILFLITLLVTTFVFVIVLTGFLYCICWIIIFVDEFINNEWKDKND